MGGATLNQTFVTAETSQRIAVLTPAAALPQTASLTSTVSGGTSPANLHSTMEPSPQHVATAPVFAAAVAGRVSNPAAEVDDGARHSAAAAQSTYSPTSSFEDLGALSASSSVDPEDSDGPEMCALVADPSGDVHVVCESDPAHPLSLAEAAVYNPPLSPTLLQDIEAKLEADLNTIAVTILFIVGFITLEFGVNDLIDHYYGESIFADVVCISVGLAVVFWVKLSKARLMRFDRWR